MSFHLSSSTVSVATTAASASAGADANTPLQGASGTVVQAENSVDLKERRRFSRPLPVPQVVEADDAQSWALWLQCTLDPDAQGQGC